MSVIEPSDGSAASNIVTRAKGLILTPTAEWEKIDQEQPSAQNLILGYVAPLAAIPPVAGVIGVAVFGYGALGVTIRPSLTGLIAAAIGSFVLTLVGVFVLSLIINALAPTFKAEKNPTKALQVAAFSGTAGWLAGIFQLFPPLAVLGLVGLVSIYTLFKGLPKLMRASQDQALAYTGVSLLCALVFWVAGGFVVSRHHTDAGPWRLVELEQ